MPDADGTQAAVAVGVSGDRFTIDGQPTFLLGASYYGGIGASPEVIAADFDRFAALGLNLVRVFATWSYSPSSSVVLPDGSLEAGALGRLLALVEEARRRGIVVDLTFARGIPGSTDGTFAAYRDGMAACAAALGLARNVLFDVGNEHDYAYEGFLSQGEVAQLAARVRAADGARLVTVSTGGLLADDAANVYLGLFEVVDLSVVAPHFLRDAQWAGATGTRVTTLAARLGGQGVVVPIYLQEEARRGYDGMDPPKADFLLAVSQAYQAGAAGWVLHTDAGFDLTNTAFFDQLDTVEQDTIDELAAAAGP